MSEWQDHYILFLFPVFFVAIWLLVTAILSVSSGWFRLMARFPDRSEPPLLQLSMQSGSMGWGVNFNNVLRLAACHSGLRVGVLKIFGIFARDFLVPWPEIEVRRYKWLGFDLVELTFGRPKVGMLTVRAGVADKLAAANPKKWPEKTPAKPVSRK